MTLNGPYCTCDHQFPGETGRPCYLHGTMGKAEWERLETQAKKGRALASAVKEWRHATLARIRLIAAGGQPKPLSPDKTLMDALGEFEVS